MQPELENKEKVLKILRSNQNGLSEEEAGRRLRRYGPNTLPQKKRSTYFSIFIRQFKSSLVYVLVVAMSVSIFMEEYDDAAIIGFILFLNAIIGFWQEARADTTLSKLEKVLPQHALIKRNGEIRTILGEEIVPGDIILLREGDRVIADARIIVSYDLEIDESLLTGESKTVKKNARSLPKKMREGTPDNMVFAGSVVVYGSAEAVATSTGAHTRFSNIAKSILNTEERKTPLQARITSLSNKLTFIILIVALFVFFAGTIRGYAFIDMFTTAVALAVAALPEGLLIAITVILVIGMRRILERKALVRELLAAETLGSVSVICVDKTGTLTEGSMKVEKLITPEETYLVGKTLPRESSAVQKLIDIGIFSNEAVLERGSHAEEQWKLNGRPTDRSLLSLAIDLGRDIIRERNEKTRLAVLPFNSNRKYMMSIVASGGKDVATLFAKGAPEILLDFCRYKHVHGGIEPLTENEKNLFLKNAERLSKDGYRIVAGGYKEIPKLTRVSAPLERYVRDLVFAGFYVIADPVRPQVKDTIKATARAGITTVMITGDHKETATRIAHDIGLLKKKSTVVTGAELINMTDNELFRRISSISVFARVTPEDKLRIIEAWQKRGEVVAMTGDGVNDTPALVKADIGIAVGSGTEVAKSASDIVLIDNNFTTIVAAIEEGRAIFANVKKVTLMLMSNAFSEVLIVTAGLAFNLPLPLLAVQILWVNLITDGLPAIALTMEPKEKNLLLENPVPRSSPIIDKPAQVFIVLSSIVASLVVMLGFYIKYIYSGNADDARTLAFALLGIITLALVLSIRDLSSPFIKKGIGGNPWLFAALGVGIILQIAALTIPPLRSILTLSPLGALDGIMIISFTLTCLFIIESAKILFIRKIH